MYVFILANKILSYFQNAPTIAVEDMKEKMDGDRPTGKIFIKLHLGKKNEIKYQL